MKPPSSNQRTRGTVRMWDDEKGFGFIEPEDGGADVFLHMRALANRSLRPAVGTVVSYRWGTDDQQRPRALDAHLESSTPGANPTFSPLITNRRIAAAPPHVAAMKRPSRWAEPKMQAGLGASVFLGALAGAAALGFLTAWVPALYTVMSSLTFTAYHMDKSRAENRRQRTPENTLHLLEALGGWPGALLAQHWLHHKTAKVTYQVIFWLIVTAHVGLWTWWTLQQGKS